MADILVAPIRTGSIIFHTGNVWKDISQEQNFFPFLPYSSPEKKKEEN